MLPVKLSLSLLLGLSAVGMIACAPKPERVDLQEFLLSFGGEYDNHEQVWRQQEQGQKQTITHVQRVVRKVSVPTIGPHVYLALQRSPKQDERGSLMLYALQLESASERIRAVAFLPRDETVAASLLEETGDIPLQTLRPAEGCDVLWRPEEGAFVGTQAGEGCQIPPGWALGSACIRERFRLDKEGLHSWTRPCEEEEETLHAGRRLRYYQGWMGIQQKRLGLKEEGDGWLFVRGFRIHSEGQIVPLSVADGTTTGYSVQLAQLTYLGSGQAILKLGLLDESGYTMTYTWADVGAQVIGMNLRWFQVGLRAEE